jgi:hypothetical protein
MYTLSLHGTWTISETLAVGQKFKTQCVSPHNMTDCLTAGKTYTVMIIPRILPMSPLCVFVGDDGVEHTAHLERFQKLDNTFP